MKKYITIIILLSIITTITISFFKKFKKYKTIIKFYKDYYYTMEKTYRKKLETQIFLKNRYKKLIKLIKKNRTKTATISSQ